MLIKAQDQASAALNAVAASLGRLESASNTAGPSFGKMAGAMTVGGVAANAITGVLSTVASTMLSVGQASLNLSSRLEQAKIGFTTMLGSAEKADQFIGQLQQKAESTAFDFPGLQQTAQSFLAMGIEAKNVIPLIDDVSNALSAAGHGGDTEALQRVGASLSEIAAQGKVTGEQLREMSRNGIAILPLLAAAFGKTTAEVRKMAEANEISSNMFFEAFHSQVAQRYGDIQAQQAKTWAVAISNLGDILGRIVTSTLKEFFEALTQGVLVLNEFLHSDRVLQWAANFKASIHDVLTALAPLGAALQAALGVTGIGSAPSIKAATPTSAQARDSWAVPPAALKSADDYAAKIKIAGENIHHITAELTALSEQQNDLKNQIDDIQNTYKLRLTGLRDQQDAINASIEATKEKWAAVIEPLQRTQTALQRLEEDTKGAFAKILDPLKAQLDGVNRKIADTKSAYEKVITPLERQIAAIDKATAALTKQREVLGKIADLALRQSRLNALGDPNKRADIAGQLKSLELTQDDLERNKELLELSNKKGKNDKAIAGAQKAIDANKRSQLQLEGQLAALVDKGLTAQNAKQEVLNQAKAEQLAIDKEQADLTAAKAKEPLEAALAAAKAQLQTLLDPLEAQAASITKLIEDVSRTEAAALKPITDAQATVARQIQDASQALQDALAPLEAASKAVAAQITATEAAERAALAPLEARLRYLEAQAAELEIQKRKIQDQIALWKEAAEAAKTAAADAAKITPALDLSGGKTPGGAPPALEGKSFIPQSTIDNINAFAEALAKMNAQIEAMNASGQLTLISNAVLLLGTVIAGSAIASGLAGIGLGIASLISGAAAFVGGLAIMGAALSGLAIALGLPVLAVGAVAAALALLVTTTAAYVLNINGFRDKVDAAFNGMLTTVTTVLKDIGTNISKFFTALGDHSSPERKAAETAGLFLVDALTGGMGTRIKDLVTTIGPKIQEQIEAIKADPGLLKGFIDAGTTLVDIFKDGFLAGLTGLGVKIGERIAEEIGKIPKPTLPSWLQGMLGGGSGGVQNSFRGGGGETYPGSGIASDSADSSNAIAIITRTALKYGIDPRIAVALAKAESGLNPSAVGDSGASVGLFQLHERGQGAGMSFEQRADATTNAEKFLAAHGALYKQLVAEGLQGRELAETFGRLAEVSDPQFAYRYGDAWESLGGSLDGANLMALKADDSTLQLNSSLSASDQAAAAAAASQAKLGQIMQGAIAPTAALAGAQQGAATQGGQFATVLDQLYNSVANGRTPLETLQLQLVEIAAKAGEQGAAGELNALVTGTENGAQALENLAKNLAKTNPAIADLVTAYEAAGGAAQATDAETAKFALDLLNIRKVAQDQATAIGGAIGGAAVGIIKQMTPATDAVASVTTKFTELQPQIEASTKLVQDFQAAIDSLKTNALDDQTRSWNEMASAIRKATKELQKFNEEGGGDGGGGGGSSDISDAISGGAIDLIPSFALGGMMTHDGLARLHKGEIVLPPQRRVSSPGQVPARSGGGAPVVHAPVTIINNGTLVKQQDFEEVVSKAVVRSMRGGRFGK